jgi:hypothetical protein
MSPETERCFLKCLTLSTIYFNYDLQHETVLHVNPLPRVMHVSPGLTSVDYCFQPRHNAYASLKQSEALDVWLNWLGNIQKSAGQNFIFEISARPTSTNQLPRRGTLEESPCVDAADLQPSLHCLIILYQNHVHQFIALEV